MKTSITLFIFVLIITSSFAQDPAIQWQNTIGGDNTDFLTDINPTADGGYILGGYSTSNISGDKTENSNGGADIWIVKTDSTGSIQWQNTIGGSDNDYLKSVFQTSDLGYFLVAQSNSNISGDKTENSKGDSDLWILKLDTTGDILWQHTYGGSNGEYYPYGSPTSDGGFIITITSRSGISGDKTEPNNGHDDAWVLKLDSNGAIEWQKSIGGSGYDLGKEILQTQDGGYILATESNSNISGDKTENSYSDTIDYWVVKLNADGSVAWDKTLGGNGTDHLRKIIITADGGYLLGGDSTSSISPDKSENNIGGSDYWVVKLDSMGIIVWENTIGGSANEFLLGGIYQLSNGNYFIAGSSASDVSGDKTEVSNGLQDAWFLNLNSSGVLTAQKTIGGSGDDGSAGIVFTNDGGFVAGVTSDSNISGDKSENSKGLEDYWLFKMQSVILGVSDSEWSSFISLYPNPTNSKFTIDLGKEYTNVSVEISNLLGQVISSEKYSSTKIIEQHILTPAGIYFVKVSTAKEGSNTLRIIKQ